MKRNNKNKEDRMSLITEDAMKKLNKGSKKYRGLSNLTLNAKQRTTISSEEALKDIIPIDWGIDENTQVYCSKCINIVMNDYCIDNG